MPWWIVPAIQAASSVLGYATRKKPQSFDRTAYGRELRRIKTQGMYSPEARQMMVGQVGREAGAVAQQETARIRGRLEANRMGGSIAGERLLSEPGRERMRMMSGASERIGIANELSKTQGAREYGMAKSQWQEGTRQEENQAQMGLIGGLAGAGVTGYGMKLKETQETQFNAGLEQAKKLMDEGNFDAAESLMMTLMARYGYAYQ